GGGVVDDGVRAGWIADGMAPLPDLAGFWLALARRAGLVEPDASGQRLMAASPEFWSDNAVHLPQMIATGWLSLRAWQEPTGMVTPGDPDVDEPALPYLRPAVLLWLATLGESEWAALDDLAAHLAARSPAWDRLTIAGAPDRDADGPGATSPPEAPRRGGPPRGRARPAPAPPRGAGLLESILLGAA